MSMNSPVLLAAVGLSEPDLYEREAKKGDPDLTPAQAIVVAAVYLGERLEAVADSVSDVAENVDDVGTSISAIYAKLEELKKTWEA